MPKLRPAWVVCIAVVLAVGAVPALRGQARLQYQARPLRLPIHRPQYWLQRLQDIGLASPGSVSTEFWQIATEWLARIFEHYRERSATHLVGAEDADPDELLPRALLGWDSDHIALLRQVAERGGRPAAWAAYADVLASDLDYRRIGTAGVDPADPQQVAREEADIVERGLQRRLPTPEAEALIDVARRWQEADPDNGFPLALEAWALYGLHRDAEARERWVQGSLRPVVSYRRKQVFTAAQELLVTVGLPELEAGAGCWGLSFRSFGRVLRTGSRMALYEGQVAMLDGRPDEALQLWRATFDYGNKLRESASGTLPHLNGLAVMGIGISPVWTWWHSGATGLPRGPIDGGHVWYGEQHSLFVEQLGAEATDAMRDSYLRAKLRGKLVLSFLRSPDFAATRLGRSAFLLFLGGWVVVQAVLLSVLLLIVGSWRRREADGAASLRPRWQFLIAGVAALPLVAAGASIALWAPWPVFLSPAEAWVAVALPSVICVLLAALAAGLSRAASAGLLVAWRGNLRRMIPTAVAMLAICYLATSMVAAAMRADLLRDLKEADWSEVTYLAQHMGADWTDPRIPPNSWYAEYPPQARDDSTR